MQLNFFLFERLNCLCGRTHIEYVFVSLFIEHILNMFVRLQFNFALGLSEGVARRHENCSPKPVDRVLPYSPEEHFGGHRKENKNC